MQKGLFHLSRATNKRLILLCILVALFAVSIAPALAQTPVPPPTSAELITDSVGFVEQFGIMVAVWATLIMFLGISVWAFMRRRAK